MYSYLISPACWFGGNDLLTIIKHKGRVAKHTLAGGKWKAKTEWDKRLRKAAL